MDLFILFIQRKESYPGQYAPEALVVWDEHAMAENPEGFEEACAEELKAHGDEVMAHKVVRVRVDGDRIRKLLIGSPLLQGEIVE
jgi:hypothetical protein